MVNGAAIGFVGLPSIFGVMAAVAILMGIFIYSTSLGKEPGHQEIEPVKVFSEKGS